MFINSCRIHHALATKATDYTKKQHVFRLQTADQAEYLFQTRYQLPPTKIFFSDRFHSIISFERLHSS